MYSITLYKRTLSKWRTMHTNSAEPTLQLGVFMGKAKAYSVPTSVSKWAIKVRPDPPINQSGGVERGFLSPLWTFDQLFGLLKLIYTHFLYRPGWAGLWAFSQLLNHIQALLKASQALPWATLNTTGECFYLYWVSQVTTASHSLNIDLKTKRRVKEKGPKSPAN